jgi:methanethiol S-methyltransferase
MKRVILFAYALVAYVVFLATFLYAVGFVGNLRVALWDGVAFVPKSMDVGREGASLLEALAIDALLLGVFAVQHSGMARRGFKERWTKIVPRAIERSTYVLFASVALVLLFWQWRPIGAPVWVVETPLVRTLLGVVCAVGWAIVLSATFHIDHFELFGLRQAYRALVGREAPAPSFATPGLYRVVRHPIYFGFIVAFWSTPVMTTGHLVFAIATTAYILVGIRLEERDLVHEHGADYERYRSEVPMLVPGAKRSAAAARASIGS